MGLTNSKDKYEFIHLPVDIQSALHKMYKNGFEDDEINLSNRFVLLICFLMINILIFLCCINVIMKKELIVNEIEILKM